VGLDWGVPGPPPLGYAPGVWVGGVVRAVNWLCFSVVHGAASISVVVGGRWYDWEKWAHSAARSPRWAAPGNSCLMHFGWRSTGTRSTVIATRDRTFTPPPWASAPEVTSNHRGHLSLPFVYFFAALAARCGDCGQLIQMSWRSVACLYPIVCWFGLGSRDRVIVWVRVGLLTTEC